MSCKPLDLSDLLRFYSFRGMLFDSYLYAKNIDQWQRLRRPRTCHICGHGEDFLFHFTCLTAVFDDESQDVVFECDDHGGKDGKFLWDSYKGYHRWIGTTPPRSYIALRNALQTAYLYSHYVARFVQNIFRYAFWWTALALANKFPSLIPVLKKRSGRECGF